MCGVCGGKGGWCGGKGGLGRAGAWVVEGGHTTTNTTTTLDGLNRPTPYHDPSVFTNTGTIYTIQD